MINECLKIALMAFYSLHSLQLCVQHSVAVLFECSILTLIFFIVFYIFPL